jgi:hypothetical protein
MYLKAEAAITITPKTYSNPSKNHSDPHKSNNEPIQEQQRHYSEDAKTAAESRSQLQTLCGISRISIPNLSIIRPK